MKQYDELPTKLQLLVWLVIILAACSDCFSIYKMIYHNL